MTTLILALGASSAKEACAELDKLRGAHPRVFVRKGELARLRRLFPQRHPSLMRRFGRLDGEMEKDLMPEPPRHGNKIEYLETMDRIRRFTRRMKEFAKSYLITGNQRHGREAARCLLHLAGWSTEAGGGLRGCDEVPMSLMETMPPVYDWIHDSLSREESERVRRFCGELGRKMFDHIGRGKSIPTESHKGRMLGFMGVAGVAFWGELPRARTWLEAIASLIEREYPYWGGDDGGWSEGPQYWSWYIGYIIPFLNAFRAATGSDALYEKPFFRKTIYFGLYCSPLHLPVSPFGDGAERNAVYAKVADARFFGRVYADPYLLWYASQGRANVSFAEAVMDSLKAAEPPQPKAPEDLPQTRYFSDIGWVAMHSSLAKPEADVFFLLKSSPYGGKSHSHSDQNAFVLSAFGEPLAIASGYYDYYGSPHHYGWTRTTRANNCVLADGEGQLPRRGEGKILDFATDSALGWGGGFSYSLGDAAAAYGGKLLRARRHVLKIRQNEFVIADDLRAPKPATFSWMLHSFEKMDIDEESAALLVKRGRARLRARVFSPLSLSLSQSNRFDPPPRRKATATRGRPSRPDQWHAELKSSPPSPEGFFVSRLSAFEEGRPPASREEFRAAPGFLGLSWRDAEGERVVLFRHPRASGKATWKGVALDGDLAAVKRNARGVSGFFLKGKFLASGKKVLFQSASAVSACLSSDGRGRCYLGLGEAPKGMEMRVRAPGLPAVFFGEGAPKRLVVGSSAGMLKLRHPGERGVVVLGR